jgi:hypothetical protein
MEGPMTIRGWLLGFSGSISLLVSGAPAELAAQEPTPPPQRAIPGITADDPFPKACISCHTVLPDGRDVRLSTLVTQWTHGVDSLLLASARAAAPTGLTLKGRHPNVASSFADIPARCLTCHARSSTMAPPFARLLHRVHLTPGPTNVFLTMFQGECTYCHKLDKTTGAWSIPSGREP